uniref:neuronal acetylcholine receptor subunit alpha-9-like isoform X1 n=1 Tax=Styela clava TaxID=7725 RepID=UPI0019394D06|nr:neuronal acetylcholine receptor subunit alpha-9-like isoform X1 [Styela clava]
MTGYKIFLSVISFIFYLRVGDCGKTATKVGLAGITTVTGGGGGGYEMSVSGTGIDSLENGQNRTKQFKNVVQKLNYDLFVQNQYDKQLRPTKDPATITSVSLGFTLRQILDLDEKNQVLKTFLWMTQSWTDEFLTWNETEYEGVTNIWVPSTSVWRPDIVIYEETGLRDYQPRLPHTRVSSTGRVRAAEPLVIETSCSINIAFFPFDYQRCSLTFTSWTFPSSQMDVFSPSRDTKAMLDNVDLYFVKTGEWTIQNVEIVKTTESFASIVENSEKSAWSGNQTFQDTSHIRKMTMDVSKMVQEVYPDRLTDFHWSDVKFTFVLRRNSSLYMQSMLFPAILLTTVALLGFYLPPDSGERIGLQITILLTFMVFLLTVGEMFPASTGPFLGVYYVLCMALLGINLFMTVLVLHLHYMPSAAVIGTKEGGGLQIKPVPVWVRWLLRIAKFQFRTKTDDGRDTPTSHIVTDIINTGRLGAKIPESKQNSPARAHKQKGPENGKVLSENQYDPNYNEMVKGDKYMVNTRKTSLPGKMNKVTPEWAQEQCHDKISPHERDDSIAVEQSDDINVFINYATATPNGSLRSNSSRTSSSTRNRHHRNKENNGSNHGGNQSAIHQKIIKNMNQITDYLKSQNQHLQESNISEEIENEWRAMARTIDHLCMKTYLAILILSHICILAAALVQSADYHASENR